MLSLMKTEEQKRAREMRAEGYSAKEIERHLHVSRSSVSTWVRDVPFRDEQRRALAARVKAGPQRAVQTIYGSIQEYGGFERPEWLD
jgi:transposase